MEFKVLQCGVLNTQRREYLPDLVKDLVAFSLLACRSGRVVDGHIVRRCVRLGGLC